MKKIIIIAFTKGHLMMLRGLYKGLNIDNNEIYCYFCGYLYQDKVALETEFNSINYFFDDHKFVLKRSFHKFIGIRRTIVNANNITDIINPDLIITFSDNRYIFQDVFRIWKKKCKVVLFHEGFGDYSDSNISPKSYIGFFIWKILIWPHHLKVATRSYTGLFNFAFLLKPELIKRKFNFKKYKIPTCFLNDTYKKETFFDILPNSIFVCFSGKDWVSGKRKIYFRKLLVQLNNLDRKVYLKISPKIPQAKYNDFVEEFQNVIIIQDKKNISESYCLHNNFDIIVTDESSAVINSIFCGIKKQIFFLNREIGTLGKYYTDRNDLIEYLIEQKIVYETTVEDINGLITRNESNENLYIENDEFDISKSFEKILND